MLTWRVFSAALTMTIEPRLSSPGGNNILHDTRAHSSHGLALPVRDLCPHRLPLEGRVKVRDMMRRAKRST